MTAIVGRAEAVTAGCVFALLRQASGLPGFVVALQRQNISDGSESGTD
jgi:hypothetical protein